MYPFQINYGIFRVFYGFGNESYCMFNLGLADGAGGNRSIGIDPQKFSRSLLGYCVEIIKNEDVAHNQMAKLACRSIQILESKNIQGKINQKAFIWFFYLP
jgi:hypothetical protein